MLSIVSKCKSSTVLPAVPALLTCYGSVIRCVIHAYVGRVNSSLKYTRMLPWLAGG